MELTDMSKLTAEQRDILSQFVSGADKLEKICANMSEKDLDYSLSPGEWTIRQAIHHLADDGDAWSMALKKAIATPGVSIRFEGFPGNEAWADALSFDKRPISSAMLLIKSHRELIAELAECFPDTWEQSISIVDSQGKELAKVSLRQIIRMLGEHLSEHIATIEAIKQKHGL